MGAASELGEPTAGVSLLRIYRVYKAGDLPGSFHQGHSIDSPNDMNITSRVISDSWLTPFHVCLELVKFNRLGRGSLGGDHMY